MLYLPLLPGVIAHRGACFEIILVGISNTLRIVARIHFDAPITSANRLFCTNTRASLKRDFPLVSWLSLRLVAMSVQIDCS
jgi:hypothetical protein